MSGEPQRRAEEQENLAAHVDRLAGELGRCECDLQVALAERDRAQREARHLLGAASAAREELTDLLTQVPTAVPPCPVCRRPMDFWGNVGPVGDDGSVGEDWRCLLCESVRHERDAAQLRGRAERAERIAADAPRWQEIVDREARVAARLREMVAEQAAALALAGEALEAARVQLVEAAERWPDRRDLQQVLSPVYRAIQAAMEASALEGANGLLRVERDGLEAAQADTAESLACLRLQVSQLREELAERDSALQRVTAATRLALETNCTPRGVDAMAHPYHECAECLLSWAEADPPRHQEGCSVGEALDLIALYLEAQP